MLPGRLTKHNLHLFLLLALKTMTLNPIQALSSHSQPVLCNIGLEKMALRVCAVC